MLRSELLCLEEKLAEARTDLARIEAAEKFFLNRLRFIQPDKLVIGALSIIHQNMGNVRIGQLAEQLNTSKSPLEKKFRASVGTSLKKFADIVRLKHLIRQYDSGNSLIELSYEAGFYDQAHFIKEFKTFTGDTPEAFFNKR